MPQRPHSIVPTVTVGGQVDASSDQRKAAALKESRDLPNELLKATIKNADISTEVAGSVDNPIVIDCSSDGLMSVAYPIGNQKRK